jgi:hypothetical protein
MVTNTASPVSYSKNAKGNSLVFHETPRVKTQRDVVFSKRRLLKWFGILSTLLIGTAAIAPDTFGIPLDLRPWVFLISIFWLVTFCAGFFNT